MTERFEAIGSSKVPVVPLKGSPPSAGMGHVWFHLRPSRALREGQSPQAEPSIETDFGSVEAYLSRRPGDWDLPGGGAISETVELIYAESHPGSSLSEKVVSLRALQFNAEGRIDLNLELDYLALPDEASRWMKARSLGLSLSYKKDRDSP